MNKKTRASKARPSNTRATNPRTEGPTASRPAKPKPRAPKSSARTLAAAPRTPDDHLAPIRRVCLALPEATEKLSHGEPTFFARKRVFAMFSNNHHNDGRLAVVVPFEPGLQAMMLRGYPEKYYYPPYVGKAGWLGIHLAKITDKELKEHLTAAWRLVGPKRVVAELAGASSSERTGQTRRPSTTNT